jgi:hypothetical protein
MLHSFITRVEAVCDLHGIPRGTPADLVSLPDSLKQNKHLAMDFWRVIGQMTSDRGRVSPPESSSEASEATESTSVPSELELQELALEAIVRTVSGLTRSQMMAADSASQQAVRTMARLLAGEDATSEPSAGSGSGEVAKEPAKRSTSSHEETYRRALRTRLAEERLANCSQDTAPNSVSFAAPQTDLPMLRRRDTRPDRPSIVQGISVRIRASGMDEITISPRRITDEELRRIFLDSADNNPLVHGFRPAPRFRLPLGLRMWLRS